jgi:hypothetical protein
LLDNTLLALLLPLYKVEDNGFFYSVPLYQLGGWQGIVFWIAPIIMVLCGIMGLLLTGREQENVRRTISTVGTIARVSAIMLLIVSGHPYPTVLLFFLFAVKGALSLKKCQ